MRLRADLPCTVTHDQLRAVCDILGLPTSDVRSLYLDARSGVSADLYIRSEDGHILAGYDGEPLVSTVELHLAYGGE